MNPKEPPDVESTDTEPEAYRVNTAGGEYVGHSGREPLAERLAEDLDVNYPEDAPHETVATTWEDIHDQLRGDSGDDIIEAPDGGEILEENDSDASVHVPRRSVLAGIGAATLLPSTAAGGQDSTDAEQALKMWAEAVDELRLARGDLGRGRTEQGYARARNALAKLQTIVDDRPDLTYPANR